MTAPAVAVGTVDVDVSTIAHPAPADGVELLGPLSGTAYKDGTGLVRRPDGQMVQLGPLMYGLLESMDGERDLPALSLALSDSLGRSIDDSQCTRLLEKLADAGLVQGFEHLAPPRRNPLLALRWKYHVTSPRLTRRLTAPFVFLFRPIVMWPVLLGFVAVTWYVLIDKGVASATVQAFNNPGLLLLVFALTIVSAGFHELGHAAACRYAGAKPGGMGLGLYLVWPAFYTDVTDAYRLPKKDRLRVDLGGLYFNAVVAVLTMVVWLCWRVDALLLLIALQLLQMVRQLSPIIRADGYHILADATGVPNLYSHMGPTIRRLAFWRRREPSALSGWPRALVTVWVMVLVPVMLSLLLGAVLLLPHLMTNAWDSGSRIGSAVPGEIGRLDLINAGANLLRLLALLIPVVGSLLITQKVVRTAAVKGRAWSAGNLPRRALVLAMAAAAVTGLAFAWWPAGQYKPVSASDRGTLPQLTSFISNPVSAVRPVAVSGTLTPGTHLSVAMIPVSGASSRYPALFVLPGTNGTPPTAILSNTASAPTGTQPTPASLSSEFPFQLPSAPPKGGTQAEAINTKDGSALYDVAYALVTVRKGAPVTQTNSAYAIAHCSACTTVAVSFQVVLVIGQSNTIAPVNASAAVNYDCPACMTTAIADQLVVTLQSQPSKTLLSELEADLKQLNALPLLGSAGTPAAVAAEVATVQQEIESQLTASGLLTTPLSDTTTSSPSGSGASGTTPAPTGNSGTGAGATTVPGTSGTTATAPPDTTSTSSTTTTTTTTVPTGSTGSTGSGTAGTTG